MKKKITNNNIYEREEHVRCMFSVKRGELLSQNCSSMAVTYSVLD